MKKLLLIFILSLFIVVSIFFIYENKKEELTTDIYNFKTQEIKKLFADEVSKKKGNTSAITYLISRDN
uniref:hypothetical protein n=1 Tax=Aliarcobacter sp. TaxID=2321116 RepID=UPI00404729DC